MSQESRGSRVQSVAKAMELLELMLRRRAPMSLQELSAAAGYPKSTVHGLLSTLRDYGMVAQESDGRYTLGLRLFECGCAVSAQWDVSKRARPYLEQLAERARGSAFLAVAEGGGVMTLDQCAGGEGPRVMPEVGVCLPLHATAQGKVVAAFLPAAEVRKRLLAAGMPPCTPHTRTDPEALLDELRQVREQGFAVEDGEYKIGLRAVAAPVKDEMGGLRCVIGVVGLFRRVQTEEFQSALRQTVAAAEALSAVLDPKNGRA